MDPDYLIFRSCYGFGSVVRMEVMVLVIAGAAFYAFLLLIGGFEDLIQHSKKVKRVRRRWQDQELRKK